MQTLGFTIAFAATMSVLIGHERKILTEELTQLKVDSEKESFYLDHTVSLLLVIIISSEMKSDIFPVRFLSVKFQR